MSIAHLASCSDGGRRQFRLRLALGVGCALLALAAGKARALDGPHVPVLVYHQVVGDAEPAGATRISKRRFAEQMAYLAAHGYVTLGLDELVDGMQGGALPDRAVVVTFDDGWKSQLEVVPVLRRHGFRAAYFIFPGTGVGDPYGNHMSWDELAMLAAAPDLEVQAHSMSHPGEASDNLVTWVEGRTAGRGRADAVYELAASRQTLEERLGVPVRHFAWPGGAFSEALVSLATRAGYRGLYSVSERRNHAGGDGRHIGRLVVDGSCELSAFRRMLLEHRHMHCARP